MKTDKNKLHIWECALALALCVTLCAGLWAQAASERLSEELVRLHVVAESDSEEDQAVKLIVRDTVIAHLTLKLENAEDVAQARQIIEKELPALRETVGRTLDKENRDCGFTVTLDREEFPTRMYEGFALPAGDYASLRITLGTGAGQNWWCVVFPPLCVSSVESEAAFEALSEGSAGVISTGDDGEYTLRFRILELFGQLRHAFS